MGAAFDLITQIALVICGVLLTGIGGWSLHEFIKVRDIAISIKSTMVGIIEESAEAKKHDEVTKTTLMTHDNNIKELDGKMKTHSKQLKGMERFLTKEHGSTFSEYYEEKIASD